MPVAAKLTEDPRGPVRLVIHNQRDMEIKALFSWSSVVPKDRLKVVYEMWPAGDTWLVYTAVGVEMSSHKGSAGKISDALLKLEGWLTTELARRG